MDTWRAVYRSSEENQKRTMVEKSMAYAFPVQVIRNVHRAKIRVPLTDPEYGIVADGGHCSLLGKGKKPVAPSDQEEKNKQETYFFHQDPSFCCLNIRLATPNQSSSRRQELFRRAPSLLDGLNLSDLRLLCYSRPPEQSDQILSCQREPLSGGCAYLS